MMLTLYIAVDDAGGYVEDLLMNSIGIGQTPLTPWAAFVAFHGRFPLSLATSVPGSKGCGFNTCEKQGMWFQHV
eukprot:617305-Pelagomonas_calceolata.AAC.1